MTVLHITSGDDKYGSALALRELIICELAKGIEPIVVSPIKNGFTEFCLKNNIKCFVFYYEWSQIPKHNCGILFATKYCLRWLLYHIYNPVAQKKIVAIIKDNKVNLVHTNTMVIDVGERAAEYSGINHVWHLRELLKENYNCYPIHKNYLNRLKADNNFFVAVSEFVRAKWISLGIDADRISLFYDGVDAEAFYMKGEAYFQKVCQRTNADTASANKTLKLVMCGSYCKAKGQKILVEAIGRLETNEREAVSVALYGKGEGGYFSETVHLIDSLSLNEHIQVMGYCDNIADELLKYDCGIMCSENEAFGRVTVEYMLAGLCTIVPDGGADSELTDNGKYAIMYEKNNIESLVKVIRLLLTNREKVAEYGGKARTYAAEKFDINKNSQYIIDFFMDKAK